jgi:hypothetical protein
VNSFSSSVSSSRYESFYYPAVLVATARRACIIQTDTTSTTGEGIEFSCLPTEPSSSSLLPSAEEQQQEEEEEDDHESSSSSSLQLLEVAPGISLPLKSLQQTWVGIRTGRINISTCLQCQEELTFVAIVGRSIREINDPVVVVVVVATMMTTRRVHYYSIQQRILWDWV